MRHRLSLAVVVLALHAAGCDSRPATARGDSSSTGRPPLDSVTPAPDPLVLELRVPPEVAAGATVPLLLRLENRGDRAIDLALSGRTIAFDVVVSRDDGTVVWQRLKNQVTQGILQLKTLAPGEVLELRAEWDQRGDDGRVVEPGSYRARGLLPTDAPSPWASAVVPLRIARQG